MNYKKVLIFSVCLMVLTGSVNYITGFFGKVSFNSTVENKGTERAKLEKVTEDQVQRDLILNTGTNEKVREYVDLGAILNQLNADEELKPLRDFNIVHLVYTSVVEPLAGYQDIVTLENGETAAVSFFIEGRYAVNEDIQVDVSIIQDRTFENGGLLYYGSFAEKKDMLNFSIFKYRQSYLVFEFRGRNENVREESDDSIQFIKRFVDKYEEYYVTEKNGVDLQR